MLSCWLCFLWGMSEERELTLLNTYCLSGTFCTLSHEEIGCLPFPPPQSLLQPMWVPLSNLGSRGDKLQVSPTPESQYQKFLNVSVHKYVIWHSFNMHIPAPYWIRISGVEICIFTITLAYFNIGVVDNFLRNSHIFYSE